MIMKKLQPILNNYKTIRELNKFWISAQPKRYNISKIIELGFEAPKFTYWERAVVERLLLVLEDFNDQQGWSIDLFFDEITQTKEHYMGQLLVAVNKEWTFKYADNTVHTTLLQVTESNDWVMLRFHPMAVYCQLLRTNPKSDTGEFLSNTINNYTIFE